METGHVTAGGGNRERLLNTHNRKPASERKRFHRGKLDGGGGKDESTQRADLVGGRSSGSAKRACREISDIAVGGELPPRPPFLADVVDRKALALERFGEERRLVRRRTAYRRLRGGDLVGFTLDEALSFHSAGEMPCCEVASRRSR